MVPVWRGRVLGGLGFVGFGVVGFGVGFEDFACVFDGLVEADVVAGGEVGGVFGDVVAEAEEGKVFGFGFEHDVGFEVGDGA